MMDLEKITTIFKKEKNTAPHPLKKSSVLLPVVKVGNKPSLLFQIRSFHLNSQPGEICFPGGKVEKKEAPLDSAVRETMEELNIDEKKIKVLGELEPIVTTFDMIIYPFVGTLEDVEVDKINYSKEEVADIFTVPLEELIHQQPLVHKVKLKAIPDESFPYHLIENGEKYKWRTNDYYVYFYQYKDYIIWGITAKILKDFLDVLKSQ
ncbi:MAG: CoA pyrophosphatase [Clostridiaceae bacterium]|nr:CoA pyrophosphatase [Clostridiaceae bacterium]